MYGETGSAEIETVIDSDVIIILGKVRHSDRIRTEVVNQSLQILDDTFLTDYVWRINHVDVLDSENGKWTINATAQGDYELGDFDPEDIESLTHVVDKDILKLRINTNPDDVMSQTQDRALDETRQEVASQTRYNAKDMRVVHTSVVQHSNENATRPMDTRILMNY